MNYRYIATHTAAHLDDAVAIAFLQEFGERKYPGVNFAEILTFPNSSNTPDGRPIKVWEAEGYLFVGMAASKFDEHPIPGRPRREGECAATLVANDLGIRERPEVKKLLDYTVRIDTKGGAGPFEIGTLMQDAMVDGVMDEITTLSCVLMLLRARLRRQKKFWDETKTEFEQYGHVQSCFVPHVGEVNIVAIQSDSKEMNAFARSQYGCSAGIVIQQNSKGQVQIHTAKRLNIKIDKAVRLIRQAEQRELGIPISDWAGLGADGTLANWHYFKDAQSLLNGSLTATEMPPTKLSLERIVNIIIGSFKREERPAPTVATELKANLAEREEAKKTATA